MDQRLAPRPVPGLAAQLRLPGRRRHGRAAIQLADVLRAIEPHWTTKTVTTDRVRNRIENIARLVRRARPSSARHQPRPMEGTSRSGVAASPQSRRVGTTPLSPTRAAKLHGRVTRAGRIAARALEFLILTAGRSGEALGARWEEIDFANATWTIPASRMKAKREHRTPLSPTVRRSLRALPRENGNSFFFIGPKPGRGFGDQALTRVLERTGRDGVTVHGSGRHFPTGPTSRRRTPTTPSSFPSPTTSVPVSRGRTGAAPCSPSACGSWPTGPGTARRRQSGPAPRSCH